jgi:hypothetical protein
MSGFTDNKTVQQHMAELIGSGFTNLSFEYLQNNIMAVETTYAKIRRLAKGAWYSNPHNLGLASVLPTITAGTSVPTGLTTTVDYFVDPDYFAIAGGPAYDYFTFLRFPVTTLGAISEVGNIGTNMAGVNSRVSFVVNSSKFAVHVLNSSVPYRFIVDGQFLSLTGTLQNTGNGYIELDYTADGRKTRHVTLDMQLGQGFVGVNMSATDTVYKPTVSDGFRLGVFGDSFTEASSATHRGDGCYRVMGDFLGINDVWSSGLGGTGYVANNTSPLRYTLGQRLVYDCYPYTFDACMFAMGINDVALNQTTVRTAIDSALSTFRTTFPTTPLFVVGNIGRAGPSAGELTQEATISAAVTAFNDPDVFFIPVSNTGEAAYLSGTGSAATPSGTGTCDWALDVNNGHLNTTGNAYIGRRLATSVLTAIANKA